MKTLFLVLISLSLNANAETFIVEMKKSLSNLEMASAKANGFQIELFDSTKTDYFRRTYRIEASDERSIKNNFPIQLIEKVTTGIITSLEPSKNPKLIKADGLFKYQWGLYNQGQTSVKALSTSKSIFIEGKEGSDIRWKDAIQKIESGLVKTPVVAVVDMGIDFDHPDLKDQIFRNTKECDEKGEVIDRDEDRDNNGLKGDCMGWNFTARTMGEARRPYDDDGHGTHVAGIISASSNNIGIAGVSSKIKILPIKVTGPIDANVADKRTISPLTDRIAKGILYAANMGVDVINLSLGWTRSMDTKYLNEAIGYALSRGIIIVAAAGNNNNNASILPCSSYEVICVGAAGIDGALANFSNYGGEVDILAPGDDIMSTFPLNIANFNINLQGYEVKSGTSQAAPFVSAAAALLRGTYPNLHRDEINQRLIDSADKSRKGESLSGMLNLKAAFETASAPSIRPVFKNLSTVLYDGNSLKLQFSMPVKNFSTAAKNVKVLVKSLQPSLHLDQEFLYETIRPGEILNARLSGEIKELDSHNIVKIEVSVEAEGVEVKTFQHEFRLARDILKDSEIKSVPFTFAGGNLPVGTIQDGKTRNLINTVEVPHLEAQAPEYYLSRSVKDKILMELKFFRVNNNTFEEVPAVLSIPGAQQLLNVTKIDLNFDGQDDYLIRAIACEKDCSDPSKAVRFLQYSLWSKDLSPLFPEKNIWKFLPKLVNVDLKSQRFFKLTTKEFGPVAVPMFIETDIIPSSQQELADSFSLPDRSISRRVYYLNPETDAEGNINLETKTISTVSYLNEVRAVSGVDANEEVLALQLLAQSKSDLMKGEVKALFSIGRGFAKKNLILEMGKKPTAKPFSISQNLSGYEHYTSQSLSDENVKDSFIGLASKNRLVMLQTNLNKTYTYDSGHSMENPLAAIASFSGENVDYTFFQTPSYLFMAEKNSNSQILRKLKINRFSFLPGTLFNNSFYPVQVVEDGKNMPALYVDETDIQNDLVSLTIFDGEELKSPIKMSTFVPPICKALNPVRLSKTQSYSVSLLCFENKQWVMKFKEMK